MPKDVKKVRMFYESADYQESRLVDADLLTVAQIKGVPFATQSIQEGVELWARKIAHDRCAQKYSFCFMLIPGYKT